MAPKRNTLTSRGAASDEAPQNVSDMADGESAAEFIKPGAGKPDALDFATDDFGPEDEPQVQVRVLKRGHGKIATGRFSRSQNRFTFHKKGDTLSLPQSVAEAQEDNGHVEIVDAPKAEGDEG